MKLLDKKDVRILWKYDLETGKIKDLRVVEFNRENYHRYKAEGHKGSDAWPMHLYDGPEGYTSDIGNCDGDWDEWPMIYVVWKIFVQKSFSSEEVKQIAIREISKIKEFREAFGDFKSDTSFNW